jgi:hypothetical protein
LNTIEGFGTISIVLSLFILYRGMVIDFCCSCIFSQSFQVVSDFVILRKSSPQKQGRPQKHNEQSSGLNQHQGGKTALAGMDAFGKKELAVTQ